MRSRLSELRRVRRIALGALALASLLSPASSVAQQAANEAFDLRGDSDALADALDAPAAASLVPSAPAAASLVPSAPDQAVPATKTKKPRPKGAPKALPLGAYPGAQRLGLRGGPPTLDPNQTPSPTIAAVPPAPRRRPAVDDKPFDPVGVRVGDLRLTPYVEQDLGYATNPGSASGPQKGSAFETTEVGLSLQSDWSQSDMHGMLKAGYTDYFSDPMVNAPYGNGVLDGRLDVTRDLSFDAEGRFNIAEQTLSSLGIVTGGASGASEHPLVETFGLTLGGAEKFGDLTLALHGSLDRTMYQDATLPGGVIDDLVSDDFNDWGLHGRASYQISPFISPFLEVDVDARRYDAAVDFNGYARNSEGVQALGGATLAFTHQLTGEASLGYGARAYQDPRLPDMRAPLINASLIWSATPLTTVTLKAQSSLADTVMAGASGAVTRNYTIDVAHALTRAVTLGASAGFTSDDYVGVALHDSTFNLGLRAEYHLSRDLVLKATATRQAYTSSAPDSNYIANVFMLGLRLQR